MNGFLKITLIQLVLVLMYAHAGAQNLLNLDDWNIGSAGTGMFVLFGNAAENSR